MSSAPGRAGAFDPRDWSGRRGRVDGLVELATAGDGGGGGAGSTRRAAVRRMFRNRLSIVGFATLGTIVLLVALGPVVWRINPSTQDLSHVAASPSGAHPLGTDTLGRDTLARLLVGGLVSLGIALLAVVLATGPAR